MAHLCAVLCRAPALAASLDGCRSLPPQQTPRPYPRSMPPPPRPPPQPLPPTPTTPTNTHRADPPVGRLLRRSRCWCATWSTYRMQRTRRPTAQRHASMGGGHGFQGFASGVPQESGCSAAFVSWARLLGGGAAVRPGTSASPDRVCLPAGSRCNRPPHQPHQPPGQLPLCRPRRWHARWLTSSATSCRSP